MTLQKISGYDILPGNIPALTKYTALIVTQRFFYSNQLSTSVFTGNHLLGDTRLFMTWALDADRTQKGSGTTTVYNDRGTAHALPHARYVLYDTDPDPKNEVYASAPYDNYTIGMNKNTYDVRYDAVFGPVGDTLEDHLRMTIFNDTFDAPLRVPVVS